MRDERRLLPGDLCSDRHLYLDLNSDSSRSSRERSPKIITMRFFSLLCSCCLLFACTTESTDTTTEKTTARAPDSWIQERVAATRAELDRTPAGRLVWQAMEAHGGLDRWYANGPLEFRFDYVPRGEGAQRRTMQQVDQWSNRARHQAIGNPTAEFGWDGKRAWVTAEDTAAFAYNTRFWSTTPYFFLAQPFVLTGEGTQLEALGTKLLADKAYEAVKVTFAPGTGDAPDDYYIAYFDPITHRQEVIRYIVSYPGYFKKGEHLPEKLMTMHDFTTVDGIVLPTTYRTHWLAENEQAGEYITDIAVSELKFRPTLADSWFEVPDGSVILPEL